MNPSSYPSSGTPAGSRQRPLYCAFVALLVSGAATAQTITSAPMGIAGVPANNALALGAVALAVAVAAAWALRRHHRWLLFLAAAVLIGGAWSPQPLWAQLLARFTQPGGQTLPIAVIPTTSDGIPQGFEPADFQNDSGVNLRIAAIDPPDFHACFPSGSAPSLPPPTGGGPAACAVGHALAVGATCRIDVDAICKALAASVPPSPAIAITAPALVSRVITVSGQSALGLTVTNLDSTVTATNITVTDHAAAPDLAVDASSCTSLAPGASCMLRLTSSTPYAPATITISGSNTANSPSTLVAFSYLGGLVFEKSGSTGKVVIDTAQELTSAWTTSLSNIAGAASTTDGAANTNAIVADITCSNAPSGCAAQRCRNIGADWYLPAREELSAIQSALCSNGSLPCNFGAFSSSAYWSSTQESSMSAWVVNPLPGIPPVTIVKSTSNKARCVRAFTP